VPLEEAGRRGRTLQGKGVRSRIGAIIERSTRPSQGRRLTIEVPPSSPTKERKATRDLDHIIGDVGGDEENLRMALNGVQGFCATPASPKAR